MKMSFIHKDNDIGREFLNYFQESWEETKYKEIILMEESYLQITAENEGLEWKYVINPANNILMNSDDSVCSSIMSLNKIAYGRNPGETISKTYDVLLFDGKIICVKQEYKEKGSRKVKYLKPKSVASVIELARKGSYAIGLDYCLVRVVLTGRRKLKIAYINPSPQVRKKDFKDIIACLEEIKESAFKGFEKEVKLGADPEFMIANSKTGKMIPASEFFPKEGMIGCDNIRIPSRQQFPVAEIRPAPDYSPLKLVENIKEALTKANKMAPYRNIKWLAGNQPFSGYSTGGHIHFSNLNFNHHVLRALDNYIGLIVFMAENPVTSEKRRKKYGFLSDYRFKDYGGFEYRTTGSWLVSREITAAVLCLAKVVASNYPFLKADYLSSLEAQQAFYAGDRSFFQNILQEIWNELENIDMYKEYAEEILPLKELVLSGNSWDEKKDIREAWDLKTSFSSSYRKGENRGSIGGGRRNSIYGSALYRSRTSSAAAMRGTGASGRAVSINTSRSRIRSRSTALGSSARWGRGYHRVMNRAYNSTGASALQ